MEMEGRSMIYLMLGVCMLGTVSAQYQIYMRMASYVVREGSTVEATCRVINHLNSAVLIYWVKKNGNETVDIATGPQLAEMFRKTNRYRVNQKAEKPLTEFLYTLHIDDAKAEDSGEIGCRIPNQHIDVFKKLTVVSPVQSVRLSSKDLDNTHAIIYTNGNKPVFTEGEERRFTCHVNGSYPQPSVQILIGDTDITDQFEETVEEVNGGITRGRYYKVERTNPRLVLGYKYSNKNLTCIARVLQATNTLPGQADPSPSNPKLDPTWYPPVSSAVEITFQRYAPKFLCDDNVTASLHQKDAAIECRLQALPAVNNVKFHYTVLHHKNETVRQNERFGQYQGLLINEPDSQKAVLKIGVVFPQHFRKYYIEASNEVGSSTYEMELVRDKRDSSSDSPGVTSQCTFILLSFISLLFVNVVLN